MARRSRLFEWVTAVAVVVVLSAGLTAVIMRTIDGAYPSDWDPRVLDLARFVERERGALYDHPVPVDFLSPQEYSERTRTDEGALTEEERTELEQFEGALRALGIISSDIDLLETGNDLADSGTLAYYDPLDERVVVRGTEVTPSLAVTLVHELTHVLQDQVFDLTRYQEADEEPTSGETYAFDSLVEGDADRIEQRYLDDLDDDTQDAIEEENSSGFEQFEEAGVPVALTALFGAMYGLGDAFVAVLESARGESVDGAFDDPPVTEEQVLDPFAYLDGDGPVEMEPADTGTEEIFDEGDFGAVSLLIMLAERIDPRQALAAATGWGGDSFAVFPRDGSTCIRLDVTGDTPEDTSELDAALRAWVAAVEEAASVQRVGETLYFESCDLGEDTIEGTGGSMLAVELAVTRSYVAAGALAEGADNDQARCFGEAVVNGLTDEELTADEAPPGVERRLAAFGANCRRRS